MTPIEFIQSQVDRPVSALTPLSDLCLDSLDLLQLELDCQNKFGKDIPDSKLQDMRTVGDLVNALC